MNCKQGDLAYTVGLKTSENNGRLVRVVRQYLKGEILPGHLFSYNATDSTSAWVVESLGGPLFVTAEGHLMTRAIHDRNLRPIRDPGEDSQDETLSWKPVPMPEIVPAMLDREEV